MSLPARARLLTRAAMLPGRSVVKRHINWAGVPHGFSVCCRPLAPTPSRLSIGRCMSGGAGGAEAGGGDHKKTGMVDVEGGKVEDDSRAEGHLVWAERAKNIVAAHRRFQLTTYNRLPEDHNDRDSIHTDTQRSPVTGFWHKEKGNMAILLHRDVVPHQQHKENVNRMSTASLAIGHLDPVQLVPVFTRVGLMPPVVRMVGDLVPMEEQYQADVCKIMDVAADAGSLYWLELGGVFFEDIFTNRTQVSVRDFRSAFVDPLALKQFEAIHIANTEFFDYLPKFCRDFLGVPVEEAFLYSVDRAGFSLFALRDGTDDKWREYRFPFQAEVRKYEGFTEMLKAMRHEVDESEAKVAQERSPKKAHKSNK